MYWIARVGGGPRRVNHASAAVGNVIFSFGGFQTGISYKRSVPMDIHALNTDTLRWTKLGKPRVYNYKKATCPIPFQRYGHSAVTCGKKIYIWGGRNESVCCNKLYCFDTATLSWSKPRVSGEVPTPRDGHSACMIGDRMYVFGGFEELSDKISTDLYYLDLITFKWHLVTPDENELVPKFRDFHTATAIGSLMFVFGGRSDFDSPINSQNEEYCSDILYCDTDTHTWHRPDTTGDIPLGRRSHSAFAMNGKIYIWGGYNGTTDEYYNDLHEFRPHSNVWRKVEAIGSRPSPRRRQGCVVINAKAYIFGGTSPFVDLHPRQKASKMNILPKILPFQIFYGNVEEDLMNLSDVNVLDFAPSLYSIALQKVIQKNLNTSDIPLHVRRHILNLTTPNILS